MDCLFCKIVAGQIPSTKVYEDEYIYAFEDINPEAPVHVVIIPKEHIASIKELKEEHKALIGHIHYMANVIAKEKGIYDDGFRIVSNTGEKAGQTVFHLHFHLLGGREFRWPPG